MSCRICKRSSCTESFHSLDEQERFAQREAMPDCVDTLRRMVQEATAEILDLKKGIESETAFAKEYMDRAEAAEAEIKRLKSFLHNAGRALDNAGNEFAARSAFEAAGTPIIY